MTCPVFSDQLDLEIFGSIFGTDFATPTEFRRRCVLQTRMGSDIIVVGRQSSITIFASMRFRNYSMDWHSSRNLQLKLSLVPFCHGLPGSMNAVSIFASAAHFKKSGTDKLRPIVRADVARRAMHANHAAQYLDHPIRADRSGHVDGQTFARISSTSARHLSC